MIISCVRCRGVLFGTKMVSNPRYFVLLSLCALAILSCLFCDMDHDVKTELIQDGWKHVELPTPVLPTVWKLMICFITKNTNETIKKETTYVTLIGFHLIRILLKFSFGSLNHKMETIN